MSPRKYPKIECQKCRKLVANNSLNRHLLACQGIKKCPVCSKEFTSESVTCSYSCSNTYFRTGDKHGNWKQDSYQSTCFFYHGKKCLICGEEKIVAAHHVNEDHSDNRPENLVPLCPTHHQYVHSRYKQEIQPIIDEYIWAWERGNPGVLETSDRRFDPCCPDHSLV